jgi:hypothetical protein
MALVHALAKVSIELKAIYFHFFEIFIIQIGEIAFCKPELITIESECSKSRMFLDDFEALVREIDVPDFTTTVGHGFHDFKQPQRLLLLSDT